MARKQRPSRLAGDGKHKTDGMYRTVSADQHDAEASQQGWKENVDDCNLSAIERIRGLRKWFSAAIKPFLTGPIDPQSLVRGEITYPSDGWLQYLTLDSEAGCFFINGDRHTWVEDCADALRENQQLEELVSAGKDADLIVRLAIRQGAMLQKIQDRTLFAGLVLSEKGRRKGARKSAEVTNEAHAELRPQYQAGVDRLMRAGRNYSSACQEVASALGVSGRTVERHTANPNPRIRQR